MVFVRHGCVRIGWLLPLLAVACITPEEKPAGVPTSTIVAEEQGPVPIPERPQDALSGSAFIRKTYQMLPDEKEEAIYQEIIKGNIPDFLRKLKSIKLHRRLPGGRQIDGEIWVMSDYLAIGSNDDFVRIPMFPTTAQRLASRFGFLLPTRKVVNDIYRNADIKLKPKPMPPGPLMISNSYYNAHNASIEKQLPRGWMGKLIAGHKKDVVVTNRLQIKAGRLAIYGWHTSLNSTIQPLSTWHIRDYADYSHGIRLVLHFMTVNGRRMDVVDVLKDPILSGLISDEGVIKHPYYDLAPRKPRRSS